MSFYGQKSLGIFGQTEKNMTTFCHNLFLSNAVHECVLQLVEAQEVYEAATEAKNDELARAKWLEIQTFQSSLALAATVLNEIDEIEV